MKTKNSRKTAIMLSLFVLILCSGCDLLGNALDEVSMQADLLMYGDEAKEYYASTLSAREVFRQNKAEFDRLCDAARVQIIQNDKVPPESAATWRFLWVRCHDVEYDGINYKLTDKQIAYIDDAVKAFKEELENTSNGNIEVECYFEDVEYTMNASYENEHKGIYLSLDDTIDEIERYGLPGAYDAVMFLSALPVETFAGHCSLTIKHGYGYANVFLPADIDYDYQTRASNLYTTTVALHEFIHMLGGYNPVLGTLAVPDPDEAEKYSAYQHYTGDSSAESFAFYDDILCGNVKTEDGKLLGMYPQMWQITPRYLVQIGALEYLLSLDD